MCFRSRNFSVSLPDRASKIAITIAATAGTIPENTIIKPPSAELRPDQKDSDSLPPYEILDQLIYQFIERGCGPEEIKKQGFDETMVNRVLKGINQNEYKRHQFCPILRISPKAFGEGRKMPIVTNYLQG